MTDRKKICCVGDSNTYGYDPRDPFGSRYADEIRWTCRIHSPERDIFNMGMNGLTIPGAPGFFRIPERMAQNGPMDEIVVMLGTNDLLQGGSAEKTASRMQIFLEKLLEDHPSPSILLLAPPVFQRGEWVAGEEMIEQSRKLAGEYWKLAETLQIRFADTGEWDIEVLYDGIHFSPEGHRVFAQHLDPLL